MTAKTTLAAVVAASFFALPAMAAPPKGQKPPAAAKAKNKAQAKRNKQNQRRAALQTALGKAGVSQAAQARVLSVMKENVAARQAVREAAREHKKALRELVKSNSSDDAAFTRAMNGLKDAKKKMVTLREKQDSEIQTILTPSQYAKTRAHMQKAQRGAHPGKKNRRGKNKRANGA